MTMSMRGVALTAATTLAVLLGCAAASSTAAADSAARPVPNVPLVIDGERLAPEEISRFDGRPLYLITDQRQPGVLVGFTDEGEAREEIERRRDAVAQPRSSGEHIVIYSEDEKRGDSLAIPSGTSYNHLVSVSRGCGIFGCAGNWDDVISSVVVNGETTFYTDPAFGGGWLYAWGVNGYWFNMSTVGNWDNVSSSLHVHW